MKGIIFNVFNAMIEEKFGLEMWDDLITTTQPASGGIYTAGQTYPDIELLSYVACLSQKTNIPVPDLIRIFGEYTLIQLSKLYPKFFEHRNLKNFLLSIHDYIHVEIKKLHPDAQLPVIKYEDNEKNKLVIKYYSERKLCHLAEGLLQGAASYFNEQIGYHQSACVHNHSDHCRFEIIFNNTL